MGGRKKILRDLLCSLQLLEGCLPREVKGEVLPRQDQDRSCQDSMIISVSHRISGSLMFEPTSYFTAVVCVVKAFLNTSKT